MSKQQEKKQPKKAKSATLFEKLLECRASVDFLKKGAQGHGFKFNPSSQVLMSVRDKLNELGVLIIPRITATDRSDMVTSTGKTWNFTQIWIDFELINVEVPEDKITISWYGQGADDQEKGVGKALTYAEKYLVLKLFQIPTDKDDPDSRTPAANGSDQRGSKPETDNDKTTREFVTDPMKRKMEAWISNMFELSAETKKSLRTAVKLWLKSFGMIGLDKESQDPRMKFVKFDAAKKIFDDEKMYQEKFVSWLTDKQPDLLNVIIEEDTAALAGPPQEDDDIPF